MPPEARVVIVGGGIAGMTAARELALGGVRVTLLEASETLGGKVARHAVAGVELDAGAESFATRRGTVAGFATELGLGEGIVQPSSAGAWLWGARDGALPLPKAGLLGIPGTPAAADVIAIIGRRAAARAQLDSVLGYTGARERTLGALVRRRMGRAVLDRLVTPVTMGVHSRHPDELELDVVAPGLRAALLKTASLAKAVLLLREAAPAGSAVAGIDGGMFRIADSLRASLQQPGVEVRTGTRVTEVSADCVMLANGDRVTADRVVLACQLVPAAIGIVLATLVVREPALDSGPRGSGLLVAPHAAGIRAKALTHSTAKWPWLARALEPEIHVIRLSYAAAAAGGDLPEQARRDAAELLGVRLTGSQVLGFARVEWPKPPIASPVATGVTVIGEAVAGVGLASVVAQAKREAGSLLTDLTQ